MTPKAPTSKGEIQPTPKRKNELPLCKRSRECLYYQSWPDGICVWCGGRYWHG
jgi:hypothetical protein